MYNLPPEEINGKMYQPVEIASGDESLYNYCSACDLNGGEICEVACLGGERKDKLNVYFIKVKQG